MRSSLIALLFASVTSAADWKPAATPLMTKWGKQISPDKTPWNEYPRPQLVRKDWQNLNGLWDYAITDKGAIDASDGGCSCATKSWLMPGYESPTMPTLWFSTQGCAAMISTTS